MTRINNIRCRFLRSWKLVTSLALFSTLLAFSSHSFSQNLVTNPGFENGTNGWTLAQSASAQFTESDGRSGDRLTHWSSSTSYTAETTQTVSGLTGGTYSLSLYTVGGATSGAWLWAYCDGQSFTSTIPSAAWGNWTQVTVDNISVSGGSSCTLGITTENSEWSSFDDVVFEQVSGGGDTDITVRAYGTSGAEHINLIVGGSTVANWTLSTSYQDYTFSGTASGEIRVEFDNDASGRDARVDYIQVNGVTRQAEDQATNTAFYANSACGGGGFSQWMHCNGYISFGDVDDVAPSTLVIQEGTGFCSVDGSVDSNHSGYTGSGFANTDNATGTGVDWEVNVPSSGSYTLEWRYASSSSRPGNVLINGSSQGTVDFPSTGGWTTWATVSTTVNLSGGDNTIRLHATTSSGTGNIDSLSVTGNSPQAVDCGNNDDVFKPNYIVGAAITWVLEHESIGRTFRDNGQTKSMERILVDHGFNFIRIRTFVCPECPGGYDHELYSGASHTEDWGDTAHTIQLAKRVEACDMGIFLNVMLSDNWTSIGRQNRPSEWEGMSLSQMRSASYNYTKGVLDQMTAQGVRPDMVQCGNEVNTHVAGYDYYNEWAGYSGIINSCVQAVRDTDPNIPVVLHHGRPRPDGDFPYWLDRVFTQNPPIDADIVCGSTYGTTNNGGDWWDMFNLVIDNWGKPVMSCEYTDGRRELVNDTFQSLRNNMGLGAFIWEPAGYGDQRPFDYSNGVYTTNWNMDQYPAIAQAAGLPVPSTPASQLQGTTCQ